MSETALIGLIGGLGPAATVHYYRGLLAIAARHGVTLRLLINQADMSLLVPAANRGDVETVADHLYARLEELERGGAELLAIPAVTPHMAMPLLKPRLSRPIVDILAETDRVLRAQGVRRVALMGTRATVAGRFFGRLEATVVDPAPGEIEAVHTLYFKLVDDERCDAGTAASLRRLAQHYFDTLGIDTLLLAGTDLCVAPPETWDGMTITDCAQLHMEAIVEAAISLAAEPDRGTLPPG